MRYSRSSSHDNSLSDSTGFISESDAGSGMSSPLTSISSLEDLEDDIPPIPGPSRYRDDDLRAAQVKAHVYTSIRGD